jgi:hypothetical protein
MPRPWFFISICLAIPVVLGAFSTSLAVPGMISYQGRVLVDSLPYTGPGKFQFAILDEMGTLHWANDDNTPPVSAPSTSVLLNVADGVFNAILGQPPMFDIPPSVFQQDSLFLRIWFAADTGGIHQLTPDQPITSVGFSLNAADIYDQDVTPRTVSITGYGEVIDSTGQWVGLTDSIPYGVGITSETLASDRAVGHGAGWVTLPGLSASYSGDKVLWILGSIDAETVAGATTWYSTIEYQAVIAVPSGEVVDIRVKGYTESGRVYLEVGIFVDNTLDWSKRHVVFVGPFANGHTVKAGSYMRAIVHHAAP